VVLLDAQRVGFGASGRNGGQVGTGHRQDQDVLEKRHGFAAAKALWDLSLAAQTEVRRLIAAHDIDAAWRDGVAWAEWTAQGADETAAYAKDLQDRYGADSIEVLDRPAIRKLIGSEAFAGGAIDWKAGHIHPLRFALGLARAAQAAGVTIHERSQVTRVDPKHALVTTADGEVQADAVVLACNGYHGGLNAQIAQRVMPINNFIVATEPLGQQAGELLSQDVAVADSKFVVNYWRLSEDGRLLFGGSESYGDRFPSDIRAAVRKPMLEIYPQLHDVKLDYAWGGRWASRQRECPILPSSARGRGRRAVTRATAWGSRRWRGG
jgi:gamma-glutamylputrescine oxidase